MNLPADERARDLLRENGPIEAWQTATREAIDAHLANDHASRDYWRAVQSVLGLIAPRPGPGNRDIYRSAHLLIARHGAEEAWRLVMMQAEKEYPPGEGRLLRLSWLGDLKGARTSALKIRGMLDGNHHWG